MHTEGQRALSDKKGLSRAGDSLIGHICAHQTWQQQPMDAKKSGHLRRHPRSKYTRRKRNRKTPEAARLYFFWRTCCRRSQHLASPQSAATIRRAQSSHVSATPAKCDSHSGRRDVMATQRKPHMKSAAHGGRLDAIERTDQ